MRDGYIRVYLKRHGVNLDKHLRILQMGDDRLGKRQVVEAINLEKRDTYSVSQNYCNVFYFPLVRTISQPIHIRFFWFLFRSKGVLPDY